MYHGDPWCRAENSPKDRTFFASLAKAVRLILRPVLFKDLWGVSVCRNWRTLWKFMMKYLEMLWKEMNTDRTVAWSVPFQPLWAPYSKVRSRSIMFPSWLTWLRMLIVWVWWLVTLSPPKFVFSFGFCYEWANDKDTKTGLVRPTDM